MVSSVVTVIEGKRGFGVDALMAFPSANNERDNKNSKANPIAEEKSRVKGLYGLCFISFFEQTE